MQQLEIKDFYVHSFVKQIVDLTKEGWELAGYDDVNLCPQNNGSFFSCHMVKTSGEVSPVSATDVAPPAEAKADVTEVAQKEEPVKRSFGGRKAKGV